jgi:branched-subunit amino acid ABC-type transport system permease component
MGFALQLFFTAIGIGAIYALVALGFVLIYRATNVVNFAQGDFAMLGAFAMILLAVDLNWPYWLSIIITLAGLIVFGALFNLGVYYPLRHRSFLPVIISTIGASILLENGVLFAYGPAPQSLPGMFETQGFNIGGVFGKIALGEIDHVGRSVDQYETQRHQCIDGPYTNAGEEQLESKPHRNSLGIRPEPALPASH